MHEGAEPLLRCNQCGMHIPEAKIFKHRQMDKYNKATKRILRWRDVEMASRCGEIEFSMEGGEGYERVENVTTFRYM